jgi:YVTN family beta-propeller protein
MRWLAFAIVLATNTAWAEWRVVDTVDSGSLPWGIVATPDKIYVAMVGFSGRDNVWRYDAKTLKVEAKSRFPGHAVELAFDGKTLYAGNSRVDLVVALDPATLKVTTSFKTGSGPKDLCLSRDGKTIFAGNFNTNTISVIDIASGTEQRVVVGAGPRGLDTDGKKLYVASLRASNVSVVDPISLKVTKTIAGCKGAAHTALTPDGKLLLVTCYGARHVQVIDVATDQALRLVEVEAGPNPVAITPDGKHALVGNEFANSLSTIDLATWKVTTIKVPVVRPTGVIVAPDGKRAYMTGRGSTKLVVLED